MHGDEFCNCLDLPARTGACFDLALANCGGEDRAMVRKSLMAEVAA